MAVHYETGVASTPADLVTKFATFLAGAPGWTSQTPTSGRVLSRGTIFVGVNTTSTNIQMRGALSYSAGSAWNAQPNNSGRTKDMVIGAGPYTAYHFYAGDEGGRYYGHCVVEITAGEFRHFVIGELVKSGAWTGGTYIDGTIPSTSSGSMPDADSGAHETICDANNTGGADNGQVWIDYDGNSNNWMALWPASLTDLNRGCGSHRSEGIYAPMWATQDQAWNMRTSLFPAMYFANRASSLRSPIGRIPNFRFVSMRNFYPGQIVTYGGADWQVFPIFIRRDSAPSSGNLSSGYYGYAHLRP